MSVGVVLQAVTGEGLRVRGIIVREVAPVPEVAERRVGLVGRGVEEEEACYGVHHYLTTSLNLSVVVSSQAAHCPSRFENN